MSKSALFILGNTNEFTFANAILAAHGHSREKGGSLAVVYAIHTPKSEVALAKSTRWKAHLLQHEMNPELISWFTVDLEKAKESRALEVFAHHIELKLISLGQRYEVYVDLTNGSSLYKSVLSNVAFILGVQHLFTLNIAKLPAEEIVEPTNTPPKSVGFAAPKDLRNAYVSLPDPTELDLLAPAWLSEIIRYRALVGQMKRTLTAVTGGVAMGIDDFGGEAMQAVKLMLEGERNQNAVELANSVWETGKAHETLTNILCVTLGFDPQKYDDVHQRIEEIQSRLRKNCLDPDGFYSKLAFDVKKARNKVTHESPDPLPVVTIHAKTNFGLLQRLLDYLGALNNERSLSSLASPIEIQKTVPEKITPIAAPLICQEYYFGLDGDDTGRKLEDLFAKNVPEKDFTTFSNRIVSAMNKLKEMIENQPVHGRILFCSGDDMLFVGLYHQDTLEQMKRTYMNSSGGHSCSIGFGRTAREAYVALKMAKARHGKNSIVGIELVPPEASVP